MPNTPIETRFQLPGLELAAKVWGPEDGIPTLALHGWLDNAGSFDLLAPLLSKLRIVALDCAGHGLSEFRSFDANYSLIEEVQDVFNVANLLGWEKFHLMGHSRGAAVGSLVAGTFPDRISHLTLIEGFSPLPSTIAQVPSELERAILEKTELANSKGRLFGTRKEAIAARMEGFIKVDEQAAEILAQRALIEEKDGFRWHVDARLKGTSEYRFTPEIIVPFLQRIEAKTLLVVAKDGLILEQPHAKAFANNISGLYFVTLDGRHHLHMEGQQQEIAQLINQQFVL